MFVGWILFWANTRTFPAIRGSITAFVASPFAASSGLGSLWYGLTLFTVLPMLLDFAGWALDVARFYQIPLIVSVQPPQCRMAATMLNALRQEEFSLQAEDSYLREVFLPDWILIPETREQRLV